MFRKSMLKSLIAIILVVTLFSQSVLPAFAAGREDDGLTKAQTRAIADAKQSRNQHFAARRNFVAIGGGIIIDGPVARLHAIQRLQNGQDTFSIFQPWAQDIAMQAVLNLNLLGLPNFMASSARHDPHNTESQPLNLPHFNVDQWDTSPRPPQQSIRIRTAHAFFPG